MKILIFMSFSAFMLWGADETSNTTESVVAPQTTICVAARGFVHCTNFLDGADCFIGINGDDVWASGSDC